MASQAIFGMVMTVLIATLAVVRKFTILDLRDAGPLLLGPAAAVLAPGAVHWLMRVQPRRWNRVERSRDVA